VVEKIEVKLPGAHHRDDQDIAKAIIDQFRWHIQVPDAVKASGRRAFGKTNKTQSNDAMALFISDLRANVMANRFPRILPIAKSDQQGRSFGSFSPLPASCSANAPHRSHWISGGRAEKHNTNGGRTSAIYPSGNERAMRSST